jgi:hypothetical protein
LISQRSNVSDPSKWLYLFLKEDPWNAEEIEQYENVDRQIFTNNIFSIYRMTSLRQKYFRMLINPGDFNSADLATQRGHLLSRDFYELSTNLFKLNI